MDPITGAPDNPLLTQIRQQRAMQQPDVPPPSLIASSGDGYRSTADYADATTKRG